MVDEDFDGFLARLWAATSAQEWRGIVDLAIAAAATVDGSVCLDWLRRLGNVSLVSDRGIDDRPGSTTVDESAALADLLQALLSRSAILDLPDAFAACAVAFHSLLEEPTLVDIPRRYLAPAYLNWIETDFTSGIVVYHEQFARKATSQEKVQAARRALQLGVDALYIVDQALVADALPHAYQLEPELLPGWIGMLAGSELFKADPLVAATVERYRALWNRLPLGADLPTALRDYLAAGELHRALVADAKAAVDAVQDDVVRLPKQSLGMLLERDMLLLMAQLPAELELVGCDEAKALLRDYRRLRALGASAPLNLCLLLTRAIEAQLHHALTFGHEGDVRRRIEGVGLATLAEFAMGPVDKLAGLAVRPRLEKADWEVLNHAGRIRNRVHHEPSRVCGADLDHLQRALFDVDPRAPRLLKKLAALRCVRTT